MKHFKIPMIIITCFGIAILLIYINQDSKVEISVSKFTYNIKDETDRLQFDLHIEVSNPSDEIEYLTIGYPRYILESLVTPQAPFEIAPNSSTSIDSIVSVKKNGGAEMTNETIKALISKELPVVEKFIIGKSYPVSEERK